MTFEAAVKGAFGCANCRQSKRRRPEPVNARAGAALTRGARSLTGSEMRKLIVQMQISIDGFVCGPKGELDWIFPDVDEGYTKWTVDKVWQAGAHLMGSVTYGDMASYWPTSTEPVALPMNQIPKIVFSNSLREARWAETRIVAGDLRAGISRLKEEPGKELLAHGGARFVRALVSAGLVDEYRFVEHPVALGKGLTSSPSLRRRSGSPSPRRSRSSRVQWPRCIAR
jgi:dihydrofolate reductase